MKNFFLGIVFTLAVVAIAFLAFSLGKNAKRSAVAPNITPSPFSLATPIPTKSIDRVSQVKVAITSAIKEGKFTELKNYMQGLTAFRIENSGCCQPQTPSEAVTQLDYLRASEGPWSFDQESDVAKSLIASYPEHYSNALIAYSADGYSAAFQIDKEGTITKISLSAKYSLLLE